MGYLICEKCGGYYKLQSGEFPEDFSQECECGGKLKYTERIDANMAKMGVVNCPYCETENLKDDKICKSCKKLLKPTETSSKDDKTKYAIGDFFQKWNQQNNPIKIGSLVGGCCLGLILMVGIMGFIFPDAQPLSGAALDEYKASCKEISFAELNKNPDKYQGEHVKVTGEIVEIMESGGETKIRLAVTKDSFGWSFTDVIYVVYKNETPLLEKNIVTVYGEVYGSYSYTSVIGEISLPRINAVCIEKIKDKEDANSGTDNYEPYESNLSTPEESNYTPTDYNQSNYTPSNYT